MTPSQQAKAQAGMKLSEVSELTGVSPQTLTNWHKHKQQLFKVLLKGCVVEKGNIWTKPKGGCLTGQTSQPKN